MIRSLDPRDDYTPEDFGLTKEEVKDNYERISEYCEETYQFSSDDEGETFTFEVHPVIWLHDEDIGFVLTDEEHLQELTVTAEKAVQPVGTRNSSHINARQNYSINSNRIVYQDGYIIGIWREIKNR